MQISSNEYDHTVFVLSTRIADGVGLEPFLLFAFIRRLGGEERELPGSVPMGTDIIRLLSLPTT